MTRRLAPGRPYPLGALVEAGGVNFALFSAHATRVELCVFEAGSELAIDLPECTDGVWHGFLAGAGPGLEYGYRVHGPWPPVPGDRFDPSRLLLDPCARRNAGTFDWARRDDPGSAGGLRSLVVDRRYDWGGDRRPQTPWARTVLYEVHVRGATLRHPGVPEALRGTYGGLAAPAMLAHYRALGVTALNLLPVQQHLDEERLARQGLVNYWGYNPIGFFAPEPRYARAGADPLADFRQMVRALHAEGIEVILDVVFNHTAESDHTGPTLSWRGIDNRSYYLLAANPTRYENYSGCGNTFNVAEPPVLRQVMDALRWWVVDGHVDGFRFDLTASLVRDSAFLAAVAQEPLFDGLKLIAEPWDVGPDGYRLGRFPAGWSEWNDRFRDAARGFWLSRDFGAGALAQRLAGSAEAFRHDGRAPQAGINYVAAHDGFTLRDLLSYQEKRNEANGEDNRDGAPVSLSWNCGAEGETLDPAVLARRDRLARALLATLFVAQGVPMLQAGDELGRTQRGNNNAYCQDNVLTWIDWPGADTALAACAGRLAALRRRLPALRRRRWLDGEPGADGRPDCRWLHAAGREMSMADWHDWGLGAFGLWLAGGREAAGADVGVAADPDVLCLFNRDESGVDFALPDGDWRVAFDSSAPAGGEGGTPAPARYALPACAAVVLERAG